MRNLTIWQAVAYASELGFALAATVLLGTGAGYLVDQATTALRNARGLVVVLVVMALCVGPMFFAAGNRESFTPSFFGALAWIVFIVPMWLRFDFRGDFLERQAPFPVRVQDVNRHAEAFCEQGFFPQHDGHGATRHIIALQLGFDDSV